jgi:hypothetical protein
VQSDESQLMFWRNMPPPSSGVKNKPSKEPPANCFHVVSCLAYSLALKMELTHSSKTPADFQQTTQRYIPEERTLRF